MSSKRILWIGRIAIGCFMIFAALFSPVIGNFEGLFQYLQTALSFLMPPVVVLFVLGLFWKRGNERGAFWSLVVSHLCAMMFFLLQISGIFKIHFTYMAMVLFLIFSTYQW